MSIPAGIAFFGIYNNNNNNNNNVYLPNSSGRTNYRAKMTKK
jgi:hypothetical protein